MSSAPPEETWVTPYDVLEGLARDLGSGDVPCDVVPGDGLIPAQLLVHLEPEDGRPLVVHVCFVPGQDDPPVMQYVVALPHAVEPRAVATTARFLHLVNTQLPLTGFELSEGLRTVLFRSSHPVALESLSTQLVAWPLSMIFHALSEYDALVADACSGASLARLTAGFEAVQAARAALEDAEVRAGGGAAGTRPDDGTHNSDK